MIRALTVTAIALATTAIGLGSALAQEPKADCKMFKRTSDGRWISTIDSKVGNPKSFVVLEAGKVIDRKLAVVGVNVSDTIDQLCGK